MGGSIAGCFASAGYALDLLGHGESEKPIRPHAYTMENVFSHFSSWIDPLTINSPMVLAGHSLGEGLSLLYALRNPERVKALVLINPFYVIRHLPLPLQKVFKVQLITTALIDMTPYQFSVFRGH